MTEKVFIICKLRHVKIIDFRKDIREKPSIYHSIVKLMNDNYLKRNDDDNIYLKRTNMNDGNKWLKWNNLRSEINDNWWNIHFPQIPFSYLPFQFWKCTFCSGISASPIKNQK